MYIETRPGRDDKRTDLSQIRLRDPVSLGTLLEDHTQNDAPLTLADIEEEP
jgi:hypothetical protein